MQLSVKNIIFDLGGVLLDIDFSKTRNAFIASGVHDFDSYFHQSHANPLFANLEKGLVKPVDFYEMFRRETGIAIPDEQIATHWNALLGHFRKNSIDYLATLKTQYRVFLFSNTNIIHYEAFLAMFASEFGANVFNEYFEKAYYSHELNLRKPDVSSFNHILAENNLAAKETLFVDDTLINIEGAKAAGCQTLWLQPGLLIENEIPRMLKQGL